MPGRSGDPHPCHLVEQRREEYILPCLALPQSWFTEQAGLLCLSKGYS